MTRPPEADRTAAREGDDAPVSQPPPKPSFWRTLRVVAWGFLGVRKNSEYQRDLAQINPFHVILAGLIGVVLLAAVYAVVQPSYLPKGTVERSPVPAFTPSDAPIEDRNRKPTPIEERDQRMQEAEHKGLDFKPSP